MMQLRQSFATFSLDIAAAVRSLRRTPGFLVICILSLGLAIGLNTTTFGLLDAVVDPYLPFKEPDQLFSLRAIGWGRDRVGTEREMYIRLRERTDIVSAAVPWVARSSGFLANGQVAFGRIAIVGEEFFRVLGVRPIRGRGWVANTRSAKIADGAVISVHLWRDAFGANPDLSQLQVTVDGLVYSVVGIMPPEMQYPEGTLLWLPLPPATTRSLTGLGTMALLTRIDPRQLRSRVTPQLDALAHAVADERNVDRKSIGFRLDPVKGTPREIGRLHEALIAASLVILLIACMNVANLMLVRTIARQREIGVRRALGASAWSIGRFAVAELAILAVAGGLVGIVLSLWGLSVAHTRMPTYLENIGVIAPHLSWHIVVFGCGITTVALGVAAAVPFLRAIRTDVGESLKEGGPGTTAKHPPVHYGLAVGQVACALVALMWSGLLIRADHRTFEQKIHYRGYDSPHLLIGSVNPRHSGDCDLQPESTQFLDGLASHVAAVPGVRHAAVGVRMHPLHLVVTSDMPGPVVYQRAVVEVTVATPDYFRTWGIPVVNGRDFDAADINSGGVVIVNDTTAKRLWPHMSPIGRLIKLGPKNADLPWFSVIGVTRAPIDSVDDDVVDHAPAITIVGVPACGPITAYARRSGSDSRVAAGVFRALQDEAPDDFVGGVAGALVPFEADMATRSAIAGIFTVFGLFSLCLAAFGTYGVLSYTVAKRRREFATRLALGAAESDIRAHLWHEAFVIVLAGTGIGAWIAMWAGHFVARSLNGLWYTDVFALVGAEVLLMGFSLAACATTVYSAGRSSPADLLHAD